MHVVLSKSLLYAQRKYPRRSHFVSVFIANKIFKILFTKRDLIRYYYFVNICIVYRYRVFMLKKFVFFNFSTSNLIFFLNCTVKKYQHYHQVKLINMKFLQVKKYYLLIKEELYIKPSLHILL